MPITKTLALNGVSLAYQTSGSGPAVLCIQGVGVIGQGWTPQVERMASAFQMITFDNRGVGASLPCRQPITIETMAADALAIMDAEQIDRFHLVGHSMGGLIAQHVALTAPTRIETLSLLCTFSRGTDATALSLRMLLLSLRSRLGTRAMRRAGMLRIIMPHDYLRTIDQPGLVRDLEVLFGHDLADQPAIVMTQLRAMRRYDATPRLHDFANIPTLVVSAAHDPIAPPHLGRRIADQIPNARFIELKHAGHALPVQCADELHALLLEHLGAGERTPVVPTL